MPEAPKTLEGWYCLHDFRRIDWPRWKALVPERRQEIVAEARAFLEAAEAARDADEGASALYRVVGHKYHGIVQQMITGAVGLDDWEWGVTLFAQDALQFKKLVYEMRFDEVSARFAEFGPFWLGIRVKPPQLEALLRV